MARISDADLRLLRIFSTIADCKGFAAAQAELNLSAASISSYIAAIEQRLGVRLCNRGRAGFALTDKGAIDLSRGAAPAGAVEEFSASAGALRGRLTGNAADRCRRLHGDAIPHRRWRARCGASTRAITRCGSSFPSRPAGPAAGGTRGPAEPGHRLVPGAHRRANSAVALSRAERILLRRRPPTVRAAGRDPRRHPGPAGRRARLLAPRRPQPYRDRAGGRFGRQHGGPGDSDSFRRLPRLPAGALRRGLAGAGPRALASARGAGL